MRRNPSLAVAVTTILAVAIGAAATVFSLVDSILLRPLPYRDSAHIYWVAERTARMAPGISFGPDYYSLRERKQVFTETGAYDTMTVNWSGIERPEQLDSAIATPSFFHVLGVNPLLGRTFLEPEQGPQAPQVVIVSHSFWTASLSRDPAVLSRSLTLDGVPHRVIGVMPQAFDYPRGTQVWRPMPMDDAGQRPRSAARPIRLVRIIARARPDFDERRVQAALPTLSRSILSEYPADFASAGFLDDFAVLAEPLHRRLTGDVRPALYALSGAVLLVVLIACANLANLLLARAAARRREFAVRLALGATRFAMARQLLAESGRLAVPGGIAGILLAWGAVQLLNAAKPLALVSYPEIMLDVRTLAFTGVLTLVTVLLFGTAPVFAASRVDLQETLKSGGYGSGGSRATRAARRFLVIAELAVSLVLLIGAGLLARSFLNLSRVPLGFSPQGLLTLRLHLTGPRYLAGPGQQAYYRDALAGIATLPGVRAAAAATDVPLTGEGAYQTLAFQVGGRPPLPVAQRPTTALTIVSEDYFRALGIPLRAGRLFDASDNDRSPVSVIVNQAFARTVFPGEDPLGRAMVMGRAGNESRWNIVGVAGDIRAGELGAEAVPQVYRCLCQQAGNRFLTNMGLVIRAAGAPSALQRSVLTRLYAVDAAQPVFDVKTMDQRVSASLAPQRFQLWLIAAFAAIAIVLAAVGVYGVMTFLVTQRAREIGIRMAIGARPAQVQRLVLAETAGLAIASAAVGTVGAWLLTRYLKTMLFGVQTLDAATFAVAPLLLLAVAFAASAIPVRRAAAVDPLIALREE
jgi:putative ABC transport system permease protein